jgi:hypothetical protein
MSCGVDSRDFVCYGYYMSAALFTEHYAKTKDGSWRFNVYFEADVDGFRLECIQLGWSYKDGKLMAPYEKIGGKCFTMTRVSPDLAQAIYQEAINKISVLEDRTIPYDDAGWKRPTIGQSSFKLAFPEYYASKYPPKKS